MMSGFPKFQEVHPLDKTFTCIHPCRSDKDNPNRRCKSRVNQADRKRANELRLKIMSPSAQDQLKWMQLMEYVGLCCCLQSKHRGRVQKSGDIDRVAKNWLLELVSQSQVASIVVPTSPPPPRFLAYRTRTRQDPLKTAFSMPLGQQEFDDGTLYMVKRAEDPGLVKIGITRRVADDRFAYFESSCGFEPVPIRQIRHIPYVRRIEKLVHAELSSYRRECTTCTWREECGSLHSEWFEVDEELALAVMERWALWGLCADPYDVRGQLKRFWIEFELQLAISGLLPMSKRVVEAWHKQKIEEDRLVLAFSKLRLGKKPLAMKDE